MRPNRWNPSLLDLGSSSNGNVPLHPFPGLPSGGGAALFYLTESIDNWMCLVCGCINAVGAVFCAGCEQKMCGTNARMLDRGGGAAARGRVAPATTDTTRGAGGGGGGGGEGAIGVGAVSVVRARAGGGSGRGGTTGAAAEGDIGGGGGAGAMPAARETWGGRASGGISGGGGAALAGGGGGGSGGGGGGGGGPATWEFYRDANLARIANIKEAGLRAGKDLLRPPCINPACIGGNRMASHAWVNCSGPDGPKDRQCWNPVCISKGPEATRGHTFYNCGEAKKSEGSRRPPKR